MFVVMQGHRLGIDIRFQGVGCVRERRQREGPSWGWCGRSLLSYGGFRRNNREGQEAGGDGGAKEELEEGASFHGLIIPVN